MIRSNTARAWRHFTHFRASPLQPRPSFRFQSSEASKASRIDRVTSKLPKRLQKYTIGLRKAPVSHIVSFLILHEITAIVPLFALFGLFHYTNYVPISYMTEHFENYVQLGVSRFEKYFSRKGWFGFSREDVAPAVGPTDSDAREAQTEAAMQRWKGGDERYRILVEVALAYAITKALLPIRIIGSVWATPWFAGLLMRLRSTVSRKP